MFASHVFPLDVWWVAARVRLACLIRAGSLTGMSAAAWACGLAALPWLRLPGGIRRPPLARVCLAEPAAGPGIVTLPLRWEAAGPAGPVRVLNAGLTVTPDGPGRVLLRLDGVFRLPSAVPATGLLAHRAAAACAGLFLAGVADALAGPAPARAYETGWDGGGRGDQQAAVPGQRVPPGPGGQSRPGGSVRVSRPRQDFGGPGARGG